MSAILDGCVTDQTPKFAEIIDYIRAYCDINIFRMGTGMQIIAGISAIDRALKWLGEICRVTKSGSRRNVAGDSELGENSSSGAPRARSPANEESFVTQTQVAPGQYVDAAKDVADILEGARLPEALRRSIWGSLAYFLERDGDPVELDFKSLRLLLSYISDHNDWRPPGLGVNKKGVIEAVWEDPNVFRWSLEFLPAGEVQWTFIEKKKEGGIMRDTGRNRPDAVPIPERIRQSVVSA